MLFRSLERGAEITSLLVPPDASLADTTPPGDHMKTMEEACER